MKKKLLLILAILFTATSLFAMKLYLTNTSSAGQAQANPNASLGGYRSTTELSATSMKNLFDDVSVVEALLGDVEYRMVDIYNDGADPVYKAQFYMQEQTSSPGTVLSFGYSATAQPHADNWNGEALSNESTAPASPSMTFYDFTKTAPLALGTIPAGQSKRVCVKRTVTADAPWTAHDLGRFGLKWGGVAAAAAQVYLINQNFEGTGYDNSESWTEDGTPDEDYTTVHLRGSQSLFCSANWDYTYSTFTCPGTCYIRFMFEFTNLGSGTTSFMELYNNTTALAALNLSSSRVQANHGTTSNTGDANYIGTGAGTRPYINTLYYAWVQYTKVAGTNDGVLSIYLSVDSTKPASPQIAITTGTSTLAADLIILETMDTGADVVFDQCLVSASSIGSGDLP